METTSVLSRSAQYTEDYIEAQYEYNTVRAAKGIAETGNGVLPRNLNCDQISPECVTRLIVAEHQKAKLVFRTKRSVPRVGVLLVGLGGNNGSTVAAGILANRLKLSWRTKTGTKQANWFGSLVLASTTRVGLDTETGLDVHAPLSSLLPFSDPAEWVIGGWDISGLALGDAMRRAQVLDITLQDQLYDRLQDIRPLPGIYVPDFIAANQSSRADNTLQGSLYQQLEAVRQHIRDFKSKNNLDKIVVLWTATTERFCDVIPGVHTTAADLLVAIENGDQEVSPSTVYAVAAILEGCSYINGSPQNTLVPGVIELAEQHGVFVGGDDFKSGQTKLKSVLVDFLVSAGIKPRSIVSYNHLGNNDGCNLSSPLQFRSKEISKSTVVDDMVASNNVLYKDSSTRPDHCVVIKYVPFVGDSKRALDEYTSEIFMGGLNTIVVHNTCEDSLLAAPLIVDLVLLTELFERVTVRQQDEPPTCFVKLHSVLSLLSYLCKAPMVPFGTPIINALASQRSCIVNIIRACIGLPPDNHMLLEHKIPFLMGSAKDSLK